MDKALALQAAKHCYCHCLSAMFSTTSIPFYRHCSSSTGLHYCQCCHWATYECGFCVVQVISSTGLESKSRQPKHDAEWFVGCLGQCNRQNSVGDSQPPCRRNGGKRARKSICLCEVQKVPCRLDFSAEPVVDLCLLAGAMAVSMQGRLTIHDNNSNDKGFQLMNVKSQQASCCLLDHLANMSGANVQVCLHDTSLVQQGGPCLGLGLSLTGLIGAHSCACDSRYMHAPASVPLPARMHGPALCTGHCR